MSHTPMTVGSVFAVLLELLGLWRRHLTFHSSEVVAVIGGRWTGAQQGRPVYGEEVVCW